MLFRSVFFPLVGLAEKEAFVPKIDTDKECPLCQSPLQKIWAKRKYFYGCSKYPDCSYTAPLEALDFKKEEYNPDFDWEQKCPKCDKDTKLRFGSMGPFLGCEDYPNCKGIINIPKHGEEPLEGSASCPAIGCDGSVTPRRSRFGKIFYSCSNYPDCDVIVNDLDKLGEKYVDHPKTPYVKKKKGKKAAPKKKAAKKAKSAPKKPRAQKENDLSAELEAVVGKGPLSRPAVVKKIWEYIKEKGCQDPNNKRLIVPDDLLAKVFDTKEPIDMMKISGLLSKHIL